MQKEWQASRTTSIVLANVNEGRVEEVENIERRWTGFKAWLVWGHGKADAGEENRRQRTFGLVHSWGK